MSISGWFRETSFAMELEYEKYSDTENLTCYWVKYSI